MLRFGKALVLILLLTPACRSITPVQHSVANIEPHDLDRNAVEKNALLNRWQNIHLYLDTLEPSTLSRRDQIYFHYWQGASLFHLEQEYRAKAHWREALKLKPEKSLLDQIQTALIASGDITSLNAAQRPQQWILQCGIFSNEHRAHLLQRKIASLGIPSKLKRIRYSQQASWQVWAGPYTSKNDAKSILLKLQERNIPSLIKTLEPH